MSYENPRIQMHDTVMEIIVKMSEGVPGAITVLTQILKEGANIDPDSIMPAASVLMLDTMDIYGPRIWRLYRDVCGQDLTKTLACIRGSQLGFVSDDAINRAIDEDPESLDVDSLLVQVQERLENFGRN